MGGKQTGFTIQVVTAGSVRARVRVPVGPDGSPGGYDSKSFAVRMYGSLTLAQRAAREWAQGRMAQPRLGLAEGIVRRARTLELGSAYAEHLLGLRRSPGHVAHVRRMVVRLAAEVPDLAATGAAAALEAWLAKLVRLPGGKGRGVTVRAGAPVAATTRNRMLHQLRGLCRFAVERGLLASDPSRRLRAVRVEHRLKAVFSIEECRTLLADPDDSWFLPFAVLIYTGMRVGEAVTARWEDIDWRAGLVLIQGRAGRRLKTGRERFVPLQPELAEILTPRRQESGLLAPFGSQADVGRAFERFLVRRGLAANGRSPHSCRHTFVGLLSATGEPTGVIRQYVGHTSEQMTLHYAETAARYRQQVDGWPRGVLRLR